MDPVNDQTEQETAPVTEPTEVEEATDATEPAEAGSTEGTDAELSSEDETDEVEAPAETPEFDEGGVALDKIIDMEKFELQQALQERDDRIGSLQTQIQELTARLRTVSAAYKKQQDDVTATRKRLERHAAQREEVRRGEVVSGLFDPVENLRRSREALSTSGIDADNLTGLDMVLGQFMTAFEGLGLEEVPGKGARFDPNLHEALTMMPVMDPALDGVVIEVFSAGYRVGNRLIQPARVIVGNYTAPEPEVVESEELELAEQEFAEQEPVDAEEVVEEVVEESDDAGSESIDTEA